MKTVLTSTQQYFLGSYRKCNQAGAYREFLGQTPRPHVLCLPLVCRKAIVFRASHESQKPGS